MSDVIAIIQGRMGSSRLPGKVLLDIDGKAMIQHVVERTQRAQTLNTVMVATSNSAEDDPIAAFCAEMNVTCTRGSLHDVLDRYYQAAKSQNPRVVVRITADCPLIDPALIDETVRLVLEPPFQGGLDFAANRLPPPFGRSFPIGLDVEVCSFTALERAWKESTGSFHREHVMPYIYEDVSLSAISPNLSTGISPRGFRIAQLNHEPSHGRLRWTVDTPEDLSFIRAVFARIPNKTSFNWYDILQIIQKEPDLSLINSEIRHKTMTEVDERMKK